MLVLLKDFEEYVSSSIVSFLEDQGFSYNKTQFPTIRFFTQKDSGVSNYFFYNDLLTKKNFKIGVYLTGKERIENWSDEKAQSISAM